MGALGRLATAGTQRFLPDPFTLALLLTFVSFLLGWGLTDTSPWGMAQHWYDGFWNLLAFSMQMALILVTGHALAITPPVQRALTGVARVVTSTRSAVVLVSLVSMIAATVNWGLGIIVGALLAREVAIAATKRGIDLHYPIVAAAGYTGFLVWHGGLSGSAPLTVAQPGHFLEASVGVIPVTGTLFSPMNGVMLLLLLLAVPSILVAMIPRGGWIAPPVFVDTEAPTVSGPRTPAEALDRNTLLARGIALGGIAVLASRFFAGGFATLNLNTMNFLFLFLGLLLHGSTKRYGAALGEGVRGAGGIILQFPFYAGIMGMVSQSGLVTVLADAFVSMSAAGGVVGLSEAKLLPFLSFLSAGIVNVFVPSGGGQWAVQGPVMLEAAARIGVPAEKIVMAVAYGDEWTNMLQPFWALPLLGITRVRAQDMIGYTAALMILVLPVIAIVLFVF
ncbi:MAG: short-chain fatty acid transporter [Gemmatimonadetes bacterium]|nr:short-chain fatty acid transporter [Gemmatimonadota bacterium]